jgi:D-sedoheptulose 7-phosphate isomerase
VDTLQAFSDHLRVIERLADQVPLIDEIGGRLAACVAGGGRVFWMGNGGSAAQSAHLAAELVGRFRRERDAIPSFAFSADPSVVTAIGNDYGFETIFARQVRAWCRAGDALVGLSTSGRSANVLAAFAEAGPRQVYTVALTGSSGGAMAGVAEACLPVPSDDTARIQEVHLLIGHLWCARIEAAVSGPFSTS